MSSVLLMPMPPSVSFMRTDEEYHSLKETYKLLCFLIDPKKVKVPKEVRDMARKCLEHYPTRATLEELQVTVDFFNPR